jgi:predicted SAM-dependent methyltransferase
MKLHLCCGSKSIFPGWTNVGACDFSQEVVADINDCWCFAGDETVFEIYCKDGFEHVESAEHFLINRIVV